MLAAWEKNVTKKQYEKPILAKSPMTLQAVTAQTKTTGSTNPT
jgi:hypothetical protein